MASNFQVRLPPQFTKSMTDFVDTMEKFTQFSHKMGYAVARSGPTFQMPKQQAVPVNQVANSFRRIDQAIRKFELATTRTVDNIVSKLGSTARSAVRNVTNVTTLLGDVSSIVKAAGVAAERAAFTGIAIIGLPVTIIIGAVAGSYKIMKFLFDMMDKLGLAMMKDRQIAMASGATVGGVRALQTAFTGIPDIDITIANMTKVLYNMTGPEASMIRLTLGVDIRKDNTDTIALALLAAHNFMMGTDLSVALLRARKAGLTKVFTERQLIALRNMNVPEFQYRQNVYFAAKASAPNPEAVDKIVAFHKAVERFYYSIENLLMEKLSQAGIPQALTRLSEAVSSAITKIMNTQMFDELVQNVLKGLKWLFNWLVTTAIPEIIKMIGRIEYSFTKNDEWAKALLVSYNALTHVVLKKTGQQLPLKKYSSLGNVNAIDTSSSSAVVSSPPGPPGNVTLPPIRVPVPPAPKYTTRPQVPLYTPRPPGPTYTPRVVPGPTFTPRPPSVRPGPPQRYTPRPTRQYTPRPPATARATSNPVPVGTLSHNLKEDRARYGVELQNPEVRERVYRMLVNEAGTVEGMTGILESMGNRASVRHTSISAQAHSTLEGGYYKNAATSGSVTNPKTRAALDQAVANFLAGSNSVNYATENSSGTVAASSIRDTGGYQAEIHHEYFTLPPTDQHRGKAYREWVDRMRGNDTTSSPTQNSPTTGHTNLISPFPGRTDFNITSSGVWGASRSGGGRRHSGNDLHAPDGTAVVSMTDGVVLYRSSYNQGYGANIVIKGSDGVIRRYACHAAVESLAPGTQVSQGQRIGTVGEGHVHYEEIPPMINGEPNPVYKEFEKNAGGNVFTSTTQQRGTVDPSGSQGTLQYIGKTNYVGVGSKEPAEGTEGVLTDKLTSSKIGGKGTYYDPITATGLGEGVGARGGEHQGVDVLAPYGSPIFAVGNGTIVHHNPTGSKQGDAVTYIQLDDGRFVAYMHHHLDANLKVGDRVSAGQQIGTSGQANNVNHLHFEMWQGPGRHGLMDPMKMLEWGRGPNGRLPVGGMPIHPEALEKAKPGQITLFHPKVRQRDAKLPSRFYSKEREKNIKADLISEHQPDEKKIHTLKITKDAIGPGETKDIQGPERDKDISVRNETSNYIIDSHPQDLVAPNPPRTGAFEDNQQMQQMAQERQSHIYNSLVANTDYAALNPHQGVDDGAATQHPSPNVIDQARKPGFARWDLGRQIRMPVPGFKSTTPSLDPSSAPKKSTTEEPEVPSNVRKFVNAIGATETDFSLKEAMSDKYNQVSNNPNVKERGAAGKDYGYFQMNSLDVKEGINLGMDPNMAINLMGGVNNTASRQDQADAVAEYLKLRYRKTYDALVNKGDIEGAIKDTGGKWHGPRNKPDKAKEVFKHPVEQ